MADAPQSAPHWALRFISGKYQGSELALDLGREIVVGRGSNADIVLMEDMVSRKHATIALSGNEVALQDLGSTNGTFLNGEKIQRASLKDGDRVLIGTSILKVVRSTGPRGGMQFQRGEPARAAEAASTLRPRSLHGDISEQGLPSILQLLSSSKHSGVLLIQGPRNARLHFKEGKLLRVEVESSAATLGGKKALWRVLGWSQGAFAVQAVADGVETEFEEETESLVAEGIKAADETRRAVERLPTGARRFELLRPLSPLLKDLSPKRLDTLQLVYNHGDLDALLDRNAVSDLDVYRHVSYLLQKEYVRVAP
jgi:predicted component of type VI protein secretion system